MEWKVGCTKAVSSFRSWYGKRIIHLAVFLLLSLGKVVKLGRHLFNIDQRSNLLCPKSENVIQTLLL